MNATPTLYPSQTPYGYGAPSRASFPQHFQPNPAGQAAAFYPESYPLQSANPSREQQQLVYQQYQQPNRGFASPPSAGFGHVGRPPQQIPISTPSDQSPYVGRGFASFPQTSAPPAASSSQSTSMAAPPAPAASSNIMQPRQQVPNPEVVPQAQQQNAGTAPRTAQQPQPSTSPSPQSMARDRARVTVLLDINTHLLQEVVSLQAQGKAGVTPGQGQQSPASPTSAMDPANPLNNSPIDAAKATQTKPPSQEYADCMRRLQANLAYLAAIADAKKKASGSIPAGPAIMIPPPHLTDVQELYKRLNTLFPEASHSTINKAMAFANAQAAMGSAQATT